MRKSAIARAQARIRQIERGIELIKMLPDGPFDFPVEILCNDKNPSVSLPFDLKVFKVYRKAMAGEWRCDDWRDTQHDNLSITRHRMYWPKGTDRWKDGYVSICLDTDLDGNVCQLVQKGIKEVPIMEVVCT